MRLCLISLVLCLSGVPSLHAQTAQPWPEADRLFRNDPLWLGGDAAFSVDLGHDRVLWLFGDSFIARHSSDQGPQAAFVRNSVAIQTGYGPAYAGMRFFWKRKGTEPLDFFPPEGRNPTGSWLWPQSGIRLGDTLLIFCLRMVPDHSPQSLGFRSAGWLAYRIPNPDADPSGWHAQKITEVTDPVVLATSAVRQGDFLYLLADSDQHDLYLARLPVTVAERGHLAPLTWWNGHVYSAQIGERQPIIRNASSESSLQPNPAGSGWLEVNSQGFGATDIVLRSAPALEGPWSAPKTIYRPPESDEPDAFVYAGKSHTGLVLPGSHAGLVLTYAANGPWEKVLHTPSLYVPRFARLDLPGKQPEMVR